MTKIERALLDAALALPECRLIACRGSEASYCQECHQVACGNSIDHEEACQTGRFLKLREAYKTLKGLHGEPPPD